MYPPAAKTRFGDAMIAVMRLNSERSGYVLIVDSLASDRPFDVMCGCGAYVLLFCFSISQFLGNWRLQIQICH